MPGRVLNQIFIFARYYIYDIHKPQAMDASTPSIEMLQQMLNVLDVPVYTFGPDRKVLYANTLAREKLGLTDTNTSVGAGQSNHFDEHEYYDESGARLEYPKGSAVERALEGIATQDLLLEHRNIKESTQEWVLLSCIPVMEGARFVYGILWFRDVTARKKREDKLRFLVESSKILSITTEFEKRLQQKAQLIVPSLADWCAIDIVVGDDVIQRVATVHRDPARLEWLKAYQQRYPRRPAEATLVERVIQSGKAEFISPVTQEMIDQAPHLSDEQRNDIKSLQLSSIIVLPIRTPFKVLGALTLAYAESNRAYTPDDLTFFTEFSFHLSVILENARLYQDIKQRDLSKDAFLASLSHELRNPLAPIKSAVEMLRLQNNDHALDQDIDIIQHQFDHMARLLNDLLDSTRFTRGKIKLNIEHVELTDVLRDIVRAVEASVQEKGIKLHFTYPTKSLYVLVDRTRLEQALINILSNAVKFTPVGGQIYVSTTHTQEEVSINIADSGAGMTAEELAHVFEPYYQSERVSSINTGLGIGLPLVVEIVKLLGGSVSAKSDGIELGSEFQVTLPLEKVTPTPASASPQHTQPVSSKKILVVDDNPAASDGLVRLLVALGWPAQGFYAAKNVLEHLENNTADVIFLDIGMPEMDGYQLTRELRARGHTMPIVALTGYGMREDKEKAFDAGCTAHLTKPIGIKELREILSEII